MKVCLDNSVIGRLMDIKMGIDLKSLLQEANITESRAFLRSFIKRIEINNRQAVIHYNLPVPLYRGENKLYWNEKQSAGVLPTVRYGGDRGIRTPDLCDANAALSQLSYIPLFIS